MATRPPTRTRMHSIGLVLLSIVSLESGTALAKSLFPAAGVVGTTFLRSAYSAIVLWAITRPRLRSYSARQWLAVIILGLVTAGMNITLYGAAARLPLGTATAIGFLGPITVAVAHTKRWSGLAWPILAYSGVLLLSPLGGLSGADPMGILIAVENAAGWGMYIVLTARTASLFPRADGLALSTTVSAVVMLVALIVTGGFSRILAPRVLLLGFAMAMLGTAIPYACDYAVLRKMPKQAYGVLLSLEPVVAALVAWVGLGETLGPWEVVAIGMIATAAAGGAWQAVRTQADRDSEQPIATGEGQDADNQKKSTVHSHKRRLLRTQVSGGVQPERNC